MLREYVPEQFVPDCRLNNFNNYIIDLRQTADHTNARCMAGYSFDL